MELGSVSVAVRADNNLNKVHFFLEKDMLLILRTVSLIHSYGVFRLRFFLQNIRSAIK